MDNSSSSQKHEECCYEQTQTRLIRQIYIFSMVVWVLLILGLGIFPGCNFWEVFILIIPILVFLIGYNSAKYITVDVENFVTSGLLSFVLLLIVIPVITLIYKQNPADKAFLHLSILVLIFGILSLLDVWVTSKFVSIVKHVRSILRTFAIVILIYVLFHYFITKANYKISESKDHCDPHATESCQYPKAE